MNTRKLTVTALLLSLSLIIFTVEAQLPPPVPLPGIKIGLANAVNLIALYLLGRKRAFVILVLRIVLSCIFAGGFTGFIYSISGGLVCFLFMSIAFLFIKEENMWVTSVFGAVGHNIGQICAAYAITHTVQIFWYLPVLMISAVLTGIFTGVISQLTLKRMRKNA